MRPPDRLRLSAPDKGQEASLPVDLPPDVKHNTYKLFVSKQDDLIGLIAYSLYKQQKIDFLRRHREENDGKRASEDAVDVFCSTFRDPNQVSMLRDRAEALLEGVTEELLRQGEARIKSVYHRDLVRQLKEGPGFWAGVGNGIVGNFFFAALIALIIAVISIGDIGFSASMVRFFGGEPKSIPSSVATPKAG